MKIAFQIFKSDLRNLMTNVICAIVAMGLIIVPPLYAWLTSLGFWDPYQNTGGITVAVANEDAGYQSDLVATRVDAGAQVVARLHENNQFNWVFEDEQAAVEGVKSGAYYAAIVIPSTFSADLMSVTSDHSTKATIQYYSNEKENAIAPHVTSQGATELQTQIDQAFNKTVADIVLDISDDLTSYMSGAGVQDFAQQLTVQLQAIVDELRQSQAELEAFGALVGSADTLAGKTGDMLAKLSDECRTLAGVLDQAEGKLTDPANRQAYDEALAKLPDDVRADLPTAEQLTADIGEATTKADDLIAQLEQAAQSMSDTADTLSGELGGIGQSLNATGSVLGNAAGELQGTCDKLKSALDSSDLAEVRALIGSNPDALASFLSVPTQLVEHPVFKVDNNGSSMSPFYTSLSLWVGALFLVALTSTTVAPKQLAKLRSTAPTQKRSANPRYPSPAQLYLGRYGIFALIAIAQAVVVCLGNVLFVGVQCENVGLYVLAGVVVAIVFSNLAYTLAVSFGVIGKAIMVIGLVMQIGGAGGIFPVQLSAPFFQAIYPWLPLTHSMQAFESAMFGAYGDQYWMSLACLLAFLAASLVVGLVLRRPIIRLNDFVMRKLDETKVL
ncbi:YhgE/Pip domain-containing protein [Adlercreutzia murintestinalis]|uniref:YhgE/Pip domain-containing protein n=1 Tax=Adlercreutzia murintestinalis TaxID=2941325 RepID=UPI00203E2302|nr:YhgE/Pip domain-containing protein [Adlercreutzia murintestinalis]